MNRIERFLPAAALAALVVGCAEAPAISDEARRVAAYAADTYEEAAVETLAELLRFRTVHQEGVANAEHPEFRAMTAYLEERARELGLDFVDHGAVVVVGLGSVERRLGLVTHGDVQPADPTKWAADPFSLDTLSEPGLLVGRGTEDDKGPIVAAMYAMTALADREVPLGRRIELIVSYTEESDWAPFQAFLAEAPPPEVNVALDSEYPVVTGEKGWNWLELRVLPAQAEADATGPRLVAFSGGAFASQVPEDARALVVGATPELAAALEERASADTLARITVEALGDSLLVAARGVAAHSSKPWEGVNAIAHLAAALGAWDWPGTQAGVAVRLVNDLVGTGYYGERFGEVAFEHDFMGPLTLAPTTLGPAEDGALVLGINIRSPIGRSGGELERRVDEAVDGWRSATSIAVDHSLFTSLPYYVEQAPHVPVLLEVFGLYTGHEDPEPIAIGGGTHARLVPNGVNFGPAMPGEPYTGHSEHEYLARDRFRQTLEMYTAMLVELAGEPAAR